MPLFIHADLHECLLEIGLVYVPQAAEVFIAALPECWCIGGEAWAN
jgi:hypothetical protein